MSPALDNLAPRASRPAPFYAPQARRAALSREASRWIGTPFRLGSAVPGPGGGVDCVGLCAAVHTACGACPPIEPQRLPLHWHQHHESSGILDFFHTPGVRERLQLLDFPPGLAFSRSSLRGVGPSGPEALSSQLLPGDLIAIRTGLCVHHLGVWLSDALGSHLLHVPVGGTVRRWSLETPALRGTLAGAWRILEVGS